MTTTTLAQIGLSWQGHKAALWWLGLLYRRPARFREALEELPRLRQLKAGVRLWVHALPYSVVLCGLGRLVLFGLLGLETVETAAGAGYLFHLQLIAVGIARGIFFGISFGIVVGIVVGISVGITVGIARGIAFGIARGIAVGMAFGIAFGIAVGIAEGISVWIAFGIARGIARGIAFGIAVGIAVEIAVGIARGMAREIAGWIAGWIAFGIAFLFAVAFAQQIVSGIAFGISISVCLLRVFYHPVHLLFVWPSALPQRYRWHPVAWDDLCSVAFPGLDRLLVAFGDQDRAAGEKEIARLIDSYPSQRHQALRARATLLARQAARSDRLAALDEVVAGLPEGKKGFLPETPRLREMVHEIAALQTRLDTIDRPFLREPVAQLLVKEIENFGHRVAGFHQPLATEFRAAARQWQERAERQLDEVRAVLRREPTRQVFRAGDPVDRDGEAFVPRHAVLDELERQVMLSTGCPGLVLYGRRRTGKSTVLRNLVGFLPTTVRPVGISMQDPQAFSTLGDLVGHLGREIAGVMPDRDAPTLEDLRALFRFLNEVNEQLADQGHRLLLGLDEYEQIDRKIGEGVFPEDLLATVRESIQSHRHVIWTFAGSHEISELPHAPWTSYLVSARTVEVPPFTPAETRLLLTEPLRHSTLWPRGDPSRPRFAPELWGEDGIERIHAEAAGWPHLVQLIAEAVVDLLNDEDRSHADPELLDRALDKAVVRGHTVFYELMHRESTLAGEWEYLAAFRTRDRQPPPGDEAVVRSLRRRLLVAEEDGEWRLRVPLMQRWLRQRG